MYFIFRTFLACCITTATFKCFFSHSTSTSDYKKWSASLGFCPGTPGVLAMLVLRLHVRKCKCRCYRHKLCCYEVLVIPLSALKKHIISKQATPPPKKNSNIPWSKKCLIPALAIHKDIFGQIFPKLAEIGTYLCEVQWRKWNSSLDWPSSYFKIGIHAE